MSHNGRHLFNFGAQKKLHSGKESKIKLDCDALQYRDWEDLALWISKHYLFGRVIGIPDGGLPLAAVLQKFATPEIANLLIVDDVVTTGTAFRDIAEKVEGPYQGVAIFGRGDTNEWPAWVDAIFGLNRRFEDLL